MISLEDFRYTSKLFARVSSFFLLESELIVVVSTFSFFEEVSFVELLEIPSVFNTVLFSSVATVSVFSFSVTSFLPTVSSLDFCWAFSSFNRFNESIEFWTKDTCSLTLSCVASFSFKTESAFW